MWPPSGCYGCLVARRLAGQARPSLAGARQQADIDALRRDEAVMIPAQIDFASVGGLSTESKDILRRFRPETIGHANRLPGITPAAVVAVLHHIKRQQKQNDNLNRDFYKKAAL